MVRIQKIKSFNDLVSFCNSQGYTDFTDIQKNAFLSDDFYSNKNIFVIGETSSGKTLIAQLAIVMAEKRKALYMVPYRALARQKAKEIQEFFKDDLDVLISTSEHRENDMNIITAQVDIAVIIYEKAFLFAALYPQFLDQYDIIIFDEFGLIDDEERGIKADFLFAWSKNKSHSRCVVLATPNYNWSLYAEPDDFLVVQSKLRPVNLLKVDVIRKQVYVPNMSKKVFTLKTRGDEPLISFDGASGNLIDILIYICKHHTSMKHKILIFKNDRTGVIEKATTLYIDLINNGIISKPKKENVSALKEKILERMQISEDNLYLVFDDFCFEMMLSGISFHSAALPFELRHEIENEFLNDGGLLSIVFATETLAFGLNSGVDVVVVASIFKPNGSSNKITISKNEYQNYIGRAGRLGLRSISYVYTIIPHNRLELWDNLLSMDIEKIESRLFEKDAEYAAMYLLSLIPKSPNSINIPEIKSQLASLLCDSLETIKRHHLFFATIETQCTMLESRGLIAKDDSSFDESYFIPDKGQKLQGYIIGLDTYDTLNKLVLFFNNKEYKIF